MTGSTESGAAGHRERQPTLSRQLWLVVQTAAVVSLVVVPFGYAITGVHTDVLMGAGCGLAVGVGVGLRGGRAKGFLGGPWTGILIGSLVGIFTALMAGALPINGWAVLGPPILALAVGLIDGLGPSPLSGYREVGRETLIVSVLLTVGLLPFLVVGQNLQFAPVFLLLVPPVALVAGLLSHLREGWQDPRPPPVLLLLGAIAVSAFLGLMLAFETVGQVRGLPATYLVLLIAASLVVSLGALPAAAFLLGRAAITWLRPRLQVYGRLADYLRVMWVPIGGFAVGYMTIIALFAGFYGMLERFSPGAFADAGTGIVEWLSFAFFAALGQDFTTVAPVSLAARVLVGVHLILSVGWALVLFAAVMSFIGPRLDRIARRHTEDRGDRPPQ